MRHLFTTLTKTLSILATIALPNALPNATSAQTTTPLFQETFRRNILDNLNQIPYRITSSKSTGANNNPNLSQSVCLTASQDVTNTGSSSNVPGCAPGLTGLPANGDTSGFGALRLTSNRVGYLDAGRGFAGQGERGSFIVDTPFSRTEGLIIEFDFFVYNGRSSGNGIPPGADGLSFFILDGTTTSPEPGAFGGSLGYAQANNAGVTNDGATNGFLGIGFDVFGNYSAGTEGRQGGTGAQTDVIALRGSGSGQTGYRFISGVTSNSVIGTGIDDATTIGTANEKTRAQGGVSGRRARITITSDGLLTIQLAPNTQDPVADSSYRNVFTNLDLKSGLPVNGQNTLSPIPSSFKFGFAASTGFSTAIHEIRNFIIRPIVAPPRNLRLVKRVTAVIRKGIRTEFNQFTNDPTTAIDDATGWSQPGASPVGLINLDPTLAVQSSDEVEYTIYYLAEGTNGSIADVNICDPIPTNSTFSPNSNQLSRNNSAAISSGTFFNKLQPIPITTPCPTGQNPNGAILYSLGNLSTTAGQNFGYTRFRTRVNGN